MREASSSHASLRAVGIYGSIAVVAAVAAFFAIFTQFAFWDDEGSALVTLRSFVQGSVLYREIYSPYGPFYFQLFGGLFALTGWDVSTNCSRLLVIVVWLLASWLYGLAGERFSGRLLLGGAAMIVAFAVLSVLVVEPMHPHGLAALFFSGLTLVLARGVPHRDVASGVVTGVLLGALLLTKVNLGCLAIAAVSLATVLTVEPFYQFRWLRWSVVASFISMPTLLLWREIHSPWVRELIALELLATMALLVAARALRPLTGQSGQGTLKWWVGAMIGFAVTDVLIVGRLLLSGASLRDLYEGAIGQAIKIGNVFVIPLPLSPAALEWGIVAVAGAVLVDRLRSVGIEVSRLAMAWLRLGAGAVIWLAIAKVIPIFNPLGNPISLPMVLAWASVIPPGGTESSPFLRFVRVALPALALAETLQVYPVAGSQVGIASVSFVIVGAICLGDGLQMVHAWAAERGGGANDRVSVLANVFIAALAAEVALRTIILPAASNVVAYSERSPLPFRGAGLLRLGPDQVRDYAQLVALLRANRCTTFIGYPNLNSLYLWSGIDPPEPSAPGAWPIVLDSRGQQRIVDQMRASARPCAVRSDFAVNAWLKNRPPPDTPLVHYVSDRFEQAGAVGGWQFLVAKPAG